MIAVTTTVTAAATARLAAGILTNAQFESATELLQIGAIVWTTNLIVASLRYWDLAADGPAARARGRTDEKPSFNFPEASLPDLVGPGW